MFAPARPDPVQAVPVADMAAHLAGHGLEYRGTPESAALLLIGRFRARVIAAGLDAAFALACAGPPSTEAPIAETRAAA